MRFIDGDCSNGRNQRENDMLRPSRDCTTMSQIQTLLRATKSTHLRLIRYATPATPGMVLTIRGFATDLLKLSGTFLHPGRNPQIQLPTRIHSLLRIPKQCNSILAPVAMSIWRLERPGIAVVPWSTRTLVRSRCIQASASSPSA